MIRTSAVFKCIVTLKNGAHRIVRMTIDKVAKFTAAMRMLKESPWLTRRYEDFFKELDINADDVAHCKFINEWTGETLLSI